MTIFETDVSLAMVKTSLGKVTHSGYPQPWYRTIVDDTGEHLKVVQIEETQPR